MLQAWVHSTTRFTVLAVLQQSLKFASDRYRAIFYPRDFGMGGFATALYHQNAAIEPAKTTAREGTDRIKRANCSGGGHDLRGGGSDRRRVSGHSLGDVKSEFLGKRTRDDDGIDGGDGEGG